MNFKSNLLGFLTIILTFSLSLTVFPSGYAQENNISQQKSNFWKDVRFGGGLGLGIGNGYTNIMVAPSAIYTVNQYFSTGLGAQYSYVSSKNYFNSHLYGVSLVELFNPIPQVQLSAELEQLRVNNTYTQFNPEIKDDFWNTALFLGAGYQTQNVTIGVRFNVLYKEANNVYSQAWLPFIRVYF